MPPSNYGDGWSVTDDGTGIAATLNGHPYRGMIGTDRADQNESAFNLNAATPENANTRSSSSQMAFYSNFVSYSISPNRDDRSPGSALMISDHFRPRDLLQRMDAAGWGLWTGTTMRNVAESFGEVFRGGFMDINDSVNHKKDGWNFLQVGGAALFESRESLFAGKRIYPSFINPDGTISNDIDADRNVFSVKLNEVPAQFQNLNGEKVWGASANNHDGGMQDIIFYVQLNEHYLNIYGGGNGYSAAPENPRYAVSTVPQLDGMALNTFFY